MDQKPSKAGNLSLIVAFFGLAYFCQHFAQNSFIMQSLTLYLKNNLGYTATDVATFFAILTIPWTIKPLYGLLSDYLPIFGYRRKSYLLIMNMLAVGGYLWLSSTTDPSFIRLALVATAFGTAFCDVAVDGLMVELGQKTGDTGRFQSIQWLCFQTASVITSLAGGWFAQNLPIDHAYKYAAVVTAFFPAVMVVATWLCVKEDRSPVNTAALKQTTSGLKEALKSKTLWVVAGFIVFWHLEPSSGPAMYYFQIDVLKFQPDFIGYLGAIGGISAAIGAFVYFKWLSKRFNIHQLLYAATAIGVTGSLSSLLLVYPIAGVHATAVVLTIVFGIAGQTSFLAVLSLAADNCPKRVEALTFAFLMSLYNLAGQGGQLIGSWMFDNLFHQSIAPLMLVGGGFTFLCFFIIRFMPVGTNSADEEQKDETK